MKVLLVQSHFYPAARGGGPIFATGELAKGLADLGLEVTVYSTNRDAGKTLEVPVNRPVRLEGVTVYYHRVMDDRYLVSLPLWRRIHHDLNKFDLVHLNETWTFPILVAAAYCRRQGVPYLITPHGTMDRWCVNEKYLKKKLYFALAAKAIYEHASAVHFTAASERTHLSARLPFKLPRQVIIPNPIQVQEFENLPEAGSFRRRWGLPPREPIILFMGRLHKKKGVDLLLRACSQMRGAAIIAIVGPDESGYQARLAELAAALSLGNRVIFTGLLRGEERLAAFRDSTLLALPSQQENFGMVVGEAMAAGLPVVISEFVNIGDEVREHEAGLVLPLEVDCWTRALEGLLQDSEAAARMGLAGRALARTRYATPRVAARMAAAYQEMVAQAAALN